MPQVQIIDGPYDGEIMLADRWRDYLLIPGFKIPILVDITRTTPPRYIARWEDRVERDDDA